MVVTLINPHFKDAAESLKTVTKSSFRNPDSFDDIKKMIDRSQEDIIHDTVANKKYKCYYHKCRKSYFTV